MITDIMKQFNELNEHSETLKKEYERDVKNIEIKYRSEQEYIDANKAILSIRYNADIEAIEKPELFYEKKDAINELFGVYLTETNEYNKIIDEFYNKINSEVDTVTLKYREELNNVKEKRDKLYTQYLKLYNNNPKNWFKCIPHKDTTTILNENYYYRKISIIHYTTIM